MGITCSSIYCRTLSAQLYGIVVIFLWTFVVSSLFWWAIHLSMGLRVSPEEEDDGVDISECGLRRLS